MSSISENWPLLSGNYSIGNPESNVAIVTTTSKLVFPKDSYAMAGEMKTENLGVERVVVNTLANANIRYIVVCGKESKGHSAGQSLIDLHKNGIDAEKRIIGSNGAIPFIENIPKEAVDRFREQIIEVVDMIWETDVDKILERIKLLPKANAFEKGCYEVKEIKKAQEETIKVTGDVLISGKRLDPIRFVIEDVSV